MFAVEALLRPNECMGKALEIAGDALTMPEVCSSTFANDEPIYYIRTSVGRASTIDNGK